jgi:hypothetical protein
MASPYTFPCGLATLTLPTGWELVEQGAYQATFALFDGGRITVQAMVYEQPEAIAAADYEQFLWDMASADDIEQLKPALDKWWVQEGDHHLTLSTHDEAADGVLYRSRWRNLQLRRPDRMRRLDWSFEPASRADGNALAEFTDAMHGFIQKARFAEGETGLDRVAPSATLKLVNFGGIFMRTPLDWTREREHADGSGQHVIDEPEHDRWTLWVDWDALSHDEPSPGDPAKLVRDLQEGFMNLRAATPELGLDGEPVIAQDFGEHDSGEALRYTNWHRVVVCGGTVMIGHFSFVAAAEVADAPEVAAARELVRREVLRAMLVPPDWNWRRDDA